MAKNRNKGFSLIEIVISIAILTLLLTPIVKQLSNTMRTSRLAKEQQYANENAEYVVEYFSQNNLETLGDTTNTTGQVYPTSEMKQIDRTCDIYEIDSSGNISASPVYTGLSYTTYLYTLNNVELGSRKTEYKRTAVLDDLSLKIMSTPVEIGSTKYSYRVAYNNTSDTGDFELTSEGSLVKYTEDEANNTTYVSAIVCRRLDDDFSVHGISNPNEVDLGNMTDLDSTKVALITGSSTDYDEQASNELYALAMERMKETDPERYEIEISTTDKDHSYLNAYGYINGLRKITKVSITDEQDTKGKYYYISVDVVYQNTYEILSSTSSSGSTGDIEDTFDHNYNDVGYGHDTVTHNVYSQKFYYADLSAADTDKPACPNIYFEYQPFSTDSYLETSDTTINFVEYAASEYLIVDSAVEDVKIYLYKPVWDQAYRYLFPNGSYDDDSLIVNSEDAYYVLNERSDYPTASDPDKERYNTDKVNIYLGQVANSKQATIYTNLIYTTPGSKEKIVDADLYVASGDHIEQRSGDVQFITRSSSEFSNKVNVSAEDFDIHYLKTIYDEKNQENRLFTITVTLEPVSENVNTIVLSGAKGEN